MGAESKRLDESLPPAEVAVSAKAARFNAVAAAREAGYYGRREWPRYLRAARVEFLDRAVSRHPTQPRRVFSEEYLR